MMRRKQYPLDTAHDPKHKTSSEKHGGGSVWLPVAMDHWCLLMMYEEDRSSRMDYEVYRNILSTQIQPNAAKLVRSALRYRWTMIQNTL